MKMIDLIGIKFGKLLVIKRSENYISPSGCKVVFFECECDCGNTHKVRSIHLRREKVTSCGNCEGQRHGESTHLLYRVWNMMNHRTKPDYYNSEIYFDKGIKVCEEWKKYPKFALWARANGYKKGLQIDRKENSKGYFPENCRWVTPKVNCNNRDVTKIVKYKGKDYPFMELIEKKGLYLYSATIRNRINICKWSVEDAFDKPIRKGNYQRKYFSDEELKQAIKR